ncbi:MAG: flagellar hook capping FlgD N-terminal domain-containing protein [Marmoricola sp.]
MSITPTEGVATGLFVAPTTTGSSATSATGSFSDQNTFLQLLVAQLKYQDPMNPADPTQFMSQTAQFSALQQMQSVAQQTTALVAAQNAFGATSLVGREVSFTQADGTTGQGLVSGVRYSTGGPVLTVDGADVALSQVQSVQTTGATSGTASPTSSTSSTTSSTNPAA